MAVASLQLERATLAYGDEGGGGPVVLLHGFPCTRPLWKGVAPLLAAAGHRVLTPDLAGYGASAGVSHAAGAGGVRKRGAIDGVHGGGWAMDAIASTRDWPAADGSRLLKLLVRRVRTSAAQGRISDAQAREVLAPYEGDEGGARLIAGARSLDPSQTASLSHELHESGVPPLVLWGEHDSYLSPHTLRPPLPPLLPPPS